MKKKWLFLDFDNTLMATEQYAVPSLIARFNELYENQIESPLTYDEFKRYFHGQARESLCENLSCHFQIEVEFAKLYDQREWRIMQHLQSLPEGVPMAEHLLETLNHLESQAISFALVSNNPIQRALAAMRYANNQKGNELARFFGTHFFEAGEVQKPKPDVYLRALQQVSASPGSSYAVEDSLTGATAAVKAGLTTFGFTGFADDPNEMKSKLLEVGCKTTFHHWREFPSLL